MKALIRLHLVMTFAFVGTIVLAQKELVIRSGVSLSNVDISYFNDEPPYGPSSGFLESISAGFSLGVSAPLRIADSVYLEPGIDFIQMGYSSDFKDEYYSESAYRLNYVSLPVSIRYRTNKVLDVFAGPYFSYLLGGDESFKRGDVGLQAGLDVTVYRNFGVGCRYFHGMMNIKTKIETDGFYQIHEMYNRGLQAYVFYRLASKKR